MGNTRTSTAALNTLRAEPSRPAGASLRLRVSAAAESALRRGHPWLYEDSIRSQSRPGQTGDLGVVYDRKDRFLAVGLFDADSAIRLRVLHTGKPSVVNRNFWNARLRTAVRLRDNLFDASTTGFRLVNGESEGWPGLVLDRYDRTLVIKLYTCAWVPFLKTIIELLVEQLAPQRILLRFSRNIQEFALRRFARRDGEVLFGPPLTGPVTFLESGLCFEADVEHGQKTGFFLDQRENRRRIETLVTGRSVLNAFSFSGGFSLYAARGGARRVLDLDISQHALDSAERNFALNRNNRAVTACQHERVQADAFEWLAGRGSGKFDLVILDPPSLARRETERAGALLAYGRLASLGVRHLAPGGVLLACSCSAHVSDAEFFKAVRSAATRHKPGYTELAVATEPPDHPARLPEAKYLKAIYLRFK